MEDPQPIDADDSDVKETFARDAKLEDDLATFTARVRPRMDIQNYFVSKLALFGSMEVKLSNNRLDHATSILSRNGR